MEFEDIHREIEEINRSATENVRWEALAKDSGSQAASVKPKLEVVSNNPTPKRGALTALMHWVRNMFSYIGIKAIFNQHGEPLGYKDVNNPTEVHRATEGKDGNVIFKIFEIITGRKE